MQTTAAAGPGRRVSGHRLLAQTLSAEGVQTIFGLLGDANLETMVHAHELGIGFVASRHESGAVAMATGYALTSEQVGIVTLTRGPALTNTLTALVSAVRDRAPIVVLCGAGARSRHGPQSIDQPALVNPTGAHSLVATQASDIAADFRAALSLADCTRTPVVLHLASDLLAETVPTSNSGTSHADTDQRPGGTDVAGSAPARGLSSDLVRRAASMLADARHPAILAGRGATDPDSVRQLQELAEECGAWLCTSLPAAGLFHGHPRNLGFVGGYAARHVRETLAGTDVLLAVGASLNAFTLDNGRMFPAASIIRCDHAPRIPGPVGESDLAIAAPSSELLGALLDRLRRGPSGPPARRTSSAAAAPAPFVDASDADGLDPRTLLHAIEHVLSPARRVVVDVGHFSTFPCQELTIPAYRRLIPSFGFGAVGLALGTAAGVAVACPSDDVICAVGDGGMLMSLSDLELIGRLGLPVLIVVFNDRAYGAERHHLRHAGMPLDLSRLPDSDFVGMAHALGIEAVRVCRPDELPAMARRIAGRRGPLLIDALVTPAVVADKFR